MILVMHIFQLKIGIPDCEKYNILFLSTIMEDWRYGACNTYDCVARRLILKYIDENELRISIGQLKYNCRYYKMERYTDKDVVHN